MNVVKLGEYKAGKMYAKCSGLDLRLDNVQMVKEKRDIRKEMVSGYMKLLSNFKG